MAGTNTKEELMPLAIVSKNPEAITDFYMERLMNNLPKIVTDALSTTDDTAGQFNPKDVEILVRNKPATTTINLSIFIMTLDFPKLRINLEERRDIIKQEIENIFLYYGAASIEARVTVSLTPLSSGIF